MLSDYKSHLEGFYPRHKRTQAAQLTERFKRIKMNWFAVDKFESTESKNVAEALEKNLRRDRRQAAAARINWMLQRLSHCKEFNVSVLHSAHQGTSEHLNILSATI